jgi:signal transduction histidine kinase
VEDNGVGIPKELFDRIFGIFEQVRKSDSGTGIGLAIVRKAVEKMNGRIGVDSQPGQGSRFWIELRAAEGKAAPSPTENEQPVRDKNQVSS